MNNGTQVKTHKLLQIVAKPISDHECVRTACSQLLYVTSLEQVVISSCYKVDDDHRRLATSCCHKTNTGCS